MFNVEKLFSKFRREVKIDGAGEGHRLSEPSASSVPQSPPKCSVRQNSGDGAVNRAAAEAAQHRLQKHLSNYPSVTSTSRTADSVRRQAQCELEQEKILSNECQQALDLKEHYFSNRQITVESSSVVDYSKLFFKCPDIFDDNVCLPYNELQQRIETALQAQLDSEPVVAATLLFVTCNQKDQENLKTAKEIIGKYFDNIIANQDEDKYCRIRLQNKIYLEKVAPLKYVSELLQACGFILSDDKESIIYQERSIEPLELVRDILMQGEPVQVVLDTNLKIFQPTKEQSFIPPVQLVPQDPLFYQATVGDVLRENQRQKDVIEREEMLRTKAMRKRDEKPRLNIRYKYTVLRIRMPDEMILQVIFPSNDSLTSLFDFLRSYCLVHHHLSFTLRSNTDRRLYSSEDEQSVTFTQCGLVPTALLSFQWNDRALRAVKEQAPDISTDIYIKPEILTGAPRL